MPGVHCLLAITEVRLHQQRPNHHPTAAANAMDQDAEKTDSQGNFSMENVYAKVVVERAERRFKDRLHSILKQCSIDLVNLESIASDRVVWQKTCHEAIETFEANRTKAREERHRI